VLAAETGSQGRFVTLTGEMIQDGSLAVGPRHASTGLISRRSELRSLKAQLVDLEAKIAQAESDIARLRQQVTDEEGHVAKRTDEHRKAVESLTEVGHYLAAAVERQSQLAKQRQVVQAELSAAKTQHDAANRQLDDTRAKLKAVEITLAEAEAEQTRVAAEIERLDADRQTRFRQSTEIKVELAKSEERLGNLRSRLQQFEESQQERLRAISESRQRLAQCVARADEARFTILRAESEVADLYLRKEAFAAQTVEKINQRETAQRQRTELATESQSLRAKVRKLEERIHSLDLSAGEVRHERNTLSARLREDYGIELAQLERAPTDEEKHRRDEVQQEIDDLRRKINSLGNVNLEALEELESLETRHNTLAEQHKDLTDAKNSLVRIIDKINIDSRRLFTETLETVRGHFRSLFRDLFGGGQADILLEEGVDMLESGIEIVARPPGKEPRNISLLSGGEKTMTCVALLLAIFRSRPSPFCVLDEVDAALDEANIDRFTKVLQDFLTWTQFIIVTHSKKTMTCANTIYGVTMQESGVSKQVSVRFEDVSDTGEITVPDDGEQAA
jgi:chromosome segregation protein